MIPAHFFDGLSARLHPVYLELGKDMIGIAGPDLLRSYAFGETRLAEPFAGAPTVLDFADGARCEIADPASKAAVAAALGYRESRVVRWQQHWHAALVALVLLIATVLATAKWGIPVVAERVVASLPVSMDQQAGDAAFEAMRRKVFHPSRLSDQRIAQVQAIFRSVRPEGERMPLRLAVVSTPRMPPNAMAFPNGQIVVTDNMILLILGKKADFDEQARAKLAGVMAHEVGHIEARHGMRAMARGSLMAVLSATLFGDFSAVAATMPALMLNMDYSRDMESNADMYAVARMAELGLPPEAIVEVLDSLNAKVPGRKTLPRWMLQAGDYLRSHPAPDERIAAIRRAAAQAGQAQPSP